MAKKKKQTIPMTASERIEEKFGGKWERAGKTILDVQPAVPTGSLLLDEAIGECKGWPEGSTIEAYGPQHSGKTLMGYLAIAASQRRHPEREHLIIDAENQFKFQARWARDLGVDVEKLFVKPVSSAEEAFDIMEMAILGDVDLDENGYVKKINKPGNFGVIMIDSVTQLVPLEMVHKKMDQSLRMASLASAMSQGLKKTTSAMVTAQSPTIMFFINQIRADPNKLFGCMHSSTVIHTKENKYSMSSFVKKTIDEIIITYDEKQNKFIESKPLRYFNNGPTTAENFIKIYFQSPTNRRWQSFIATKNHEVMTDVGWKRAEDLEIGNKLLSYCENPMSDKEEQILLGSLLGDGRLQNNGIKTKLMLRNSKQTDYLKWKVSKLSTLKLLADSEGISYSTKYQLFLTNYFKEFYDNNFSMEIKNKTGKLYRTFSEKILSKVDILALAIWYMDDGNVNRIESKPRCSISTKRFRYLDNRKIFNSLLINKFCELNIDVEIDDNRIKIKNVQHFHDLIKEYVIPEMQYKLCPEFRGQYKDFDVGMKSNNKEKFYVDVLNKLPISKKQAKCLNRYDINTITKNYMVGSCHNFPGIVVHNSPETRTGGNALPFYATIVLRIAKVWESEIRNDRGKILSHRTRLKFEKNKAGSLPADAIEFKINYDGSGIDNDDEMFGVGELNGVIYKVKRGYYNVVKPGTRELVDENIKNFRKKEFPNVIIEHPHIKDMIQKYIDEGEFYIQDDGMMDSEKEKIAKKKEQEAKEAKE